MTARAHAGGPGTGTKRPWTEADDAMLRRLSLADVSRAEIAATLERTVPAINGRRVALGLTRPKQPPWTRAEINRLGDLIDAHTPYDKIARLMKRSRNGIILACKRKLGERLRAANGLTIRRVAQLVIGEGGHGQKTVAWWVNKRWLKAKSSGLERNIRVVEYDDLMNFLEAERFWHLYDPARVTDPALRAHLTDLRRGLSFVGTKEAGRRLGLTHNAVQRRIVEDKLRAVKRGPNWLIRSDWLVYEEPRTNLGGTCRRYTATEEELIRQWWGVRTCAWIGERIERTASQVWQCGQRLGLPKLGDRRHAVERRAA